MPGLRRATASHLTEPFVMNKSAEQVLRFALLQLFGGHAVSAVQDISGGGLTILRVHYQVHLNLRCTTYL